MNDDPIDSNAETSQEGVTPLQEFVLQMADPASPVWNTPRLGRPARSTTGEQIPPTGSDAGRVDRDTPTV